MSARAAHQAVEILADGLNVQAGLKRPRVTGDRFIMVLLLGGGDEVRRGFVKSRQVEVECWATRPTLALDLAEAAVEQLLAAAGTRGIRSVRVETEIGDLPTGEDGWDRYRFTVGMTYRTPSERIDQS